jgi:predicted ATPase
VLYIWHAKHGCVLIDEIENGLHHSVLPKVWEVIADVAEQFDTQVFATTHSFECIRAAHGVFSGRAKYDFRLHRLERSTAGLRAVSYDKGVLSAAIEAGLEVR